MPGSLEEIFGLVVGIVSITKDLGNPADVLLAPLCAHGHSIARFRFSCMRTKKYALQGTYPREKRGEGPLYFALFRKDETGLRYIRIGNHEPVGGKIYALSSLFPRSWGTAQISAKLYCKTTQCPILVHLSRFRSPKGDSSVGLLSLLNGLRTRDSSPLEAICKGYSSLAYIST